MKKNLKTLAVMTSIMASSVAFGQVADQGTTAGDDTPLISANIKGIGQARYFQISDKKKLAQYNLTLKASVDINGFVTIHSMVQTGNSYNVGFNNIYNVNSEEFNKEHKLYLKRLYLEKALLGGDLNIQAGAMGTRGSIANTNKFSNIGWIDGARVGVKTKLGNVVVTAGQIQSGEANMMTRAANADLNYFEIALTTELMDKLLLEAGVEILEGETFASVATNYDIEVAAGRVLKLMADAKVQTDNGAFKVGAGVKDVISLISGKKSAVKLSVNYEYVHGDFAQGMNVLANGMHMGYTGGAVVLKSSFPISKKYGVTGFTNVRVGNEKSDMRVEVGVKKVLFNKKVKTKR